MLTKIVTNAFSSRVATSRIASSLSLLANVLVVLLLPLPASVLVILLLPLLASVLVLLPPPPPPPPPPPLLVLAFASQRRRPSPLLLLLLEPVWPFSIAPNCCGIVGDKGDARPSSTARSLAALARRLPSDLRRNRLFEN